jgi:hypothetical protein
MDSSIFKNRKKYPELKSPPRNWPALLEGSGGAAFKKWKKSSGQKKGRLDRVKIWQSRG